MILTVHHPTTCRCDRPVRAVRQSHRRRPARLYRQRGIDRSAAPLGGRKGGGFRDGAGDVVQARTIPGPLRDVVVEGRGGVATTDLAGALRGLRARLPPEVWLRRTPATSGEAVAALAVRVAVAAQQQEPRAGAGRRGAVAARGPAVCGCGQGGARVGPAGG